MERLIAKWPVSSGPTMSMPMSRRIMVNHFVGKAP